MMDNVTSDEAKEIVISLAIRSKQNGMSKDKQAEIQALGRRLGRQFANMFNWNTGYKKQNPFDFHESKITRVNIKG